MQQELNKNNISRKHLLSSLITGLLVGVIAGAPLGWFVHQFYAEQRLAQILICREKNRDKPEAIVQTICGSRF